MRAGLSLTVAVMLVAALAGPARAHMRMCEIDQPLADPPAAPMPPAADEPRLPTTPARHACVPGALDDAGCWPDAPIPAPAPRTTPLSSDVYLAAAARPLPEPEVSPWRFPSRRPRPLAPGHARRIERPPRPIA